MFRPYITESQLEQAEDSPPKDFHELKTQTQLEILRLQENFQRFLAGDAPNVYIAWETEFPSQFEIEISEESDSNPTPTPSTPETLIDQVTERINIPDLSELATDEFPLFPKTNFGGEEFLIILPHAPCSHMEIPLDIWHCELCHATLGSTDEFRDVHMKSRSHQEKFQVYLETKCKQKPICYKPQT